MPKWHDFISMGLATIVAMLGLNYAAANFTSVRTIIKGS